MEAKHTKTPWMLGRGSLIEIFARNPDDHSDANSTDALHVATIQRRGGKSVEQSHADAAFIVRACNAHDDLVKVLKAIVAADDKAIEALKQLGAPIPADAAMLTEAARAALVKAGAA